MLTFRPATLLKRDSSTAVFLWILRDFWAHLFWRTSCEHWKAVKQLGKLCTKSFNRSDQCLWTNFTCYFCFFCYICNLINFGHTKSFQESLSITWPAADAILSTKNTKIDDLLAHLWSAFPLYTPWKDQKTLFSGILRGHKMETVATWLTWQSMRLFPVTTSKLHSTFLLIRSYNICKKNLVHIWR